MIPRVQQLCRKLKPLLGRQIDGLWAAYLADSDPRGRADIEQALELLAVKHLHQDFEPDRAPFPPPSQSFSTAGDLALGQITYGQRALYPFRLQSGRLKEHLLLAGRSGAGKTNAAFILIHGAMERGIHVLALDWKRSYRHLASVRPDLRVYTIGRDLAPFRFNPLIPPPGCEPHVWIKLIVDVIAGAYLGGEGVISLLVAGLDHLYSECGVFDGWPTRWPTVEDLLGWLRKSKLRGRAALWQASAERILLSMSYGEFGAVLRTQSNAHVNELLAHNVVFEMDGLSSSSDRALFSEALTLYLYRLRLSHGPQEQLTNLIVLEEAHHVLSRREAGARESVLETSIRMIRQYGIGYVFVDQSASLLSQVAFANSYATIALSQKLRGDIQAIAGAMNLTDEQKEALSTLPIGTAVVRLADEHPEPFLVQIPRSPVQEGAIGDTEIRRRMAACSGDTAPQSPEQRQPAAIPVVPAREKNNETLRPNVPRPPSPGRSTTDPLPLSEPVVVVDVQPPRDVLTRDAVRFLADVADRPLSTTVSRYQRLHLSRRRADAIRRDLLAAGAIAALPIATRSGQVVLHELTDHGRTLCQHEGIVACAPPPESLEHRFWARRVAAEFERAGYDVTHEQTITGRGQVDLVALRPGQRVAIEIETGKSDVDANLAKLVDAGFDRILVVASCPAAVEVCRRAIDRMHTGALPIELTTWLDYG